MTRSKAAMIPFSLALLGLIMSAGCGTEGGDGNSGGPAMLKVVATTGMIADAVREIGGRHVQVEGMMGPGVDPHLYKASEGDVRRLLEADVVFINGLHLEARMGEVLRNMRGNTRTIAVAENVPTERLISPTGARGTHDPHVWFDVSLWSYAVTAIRDGLSESDPDHADEYASRAKAYLDVLERLDQDIKRLSATVPSEHRILVTAHDAFSYFGQAYGFEVHGLQGISTVSEAGARDVQSLSSLIADRGIPVIFVESSVSPRAIEAVKAAVGARGFEVGIGEELFSDALGTKGSPEGTYVGMVRHNIEAIISGLGGAIQTGDTP